MATKDKSLILRLFLPWICIVILFSLTEHEIDFSSYESNIKNRIDSNAENFIEIRIEYDYSNTNEIESGLINPVEEKLLYNNLFKNVSSVITEKYSLVWIIPDENTAPDMIKNQVESVVQDCIHSYSKDEYITKADVNIRENSFFPDFSIAVNYPSDENQQEPGDIYDLQKLVEELYENISGLQEVVRAELIGGIDRELFFSFDLGRMNARRLSVSRINEYFCRQRHALQSGSIQTERMNLPVVYDNRCGSVSGIEQEILDIKDGSPVRIKDVADVNLAYTNRQNFARFVNQDAWVIMVYRNPAFSSDNLNKAAASIIRDFSDSGKITSQQVSIIGNINYPFVQGQHKSIRMFVIALVCIAVFILFAAGFRPGLLYISGIIFTILGAMSLISILSLGFSIEIFTGCLFGITFGLLMGIANVRLSASDSQNGLSGKFLSLFGIMLLVMLILCGLLIASYGFNESCSQFCIYFCVSFIITSVYLFIISPFIRNIGRKPDSHHEKNNSGLPGLGFIKIIRVKTDNFIKVISDGYYAVISRINKSRGIFAGMSVVLMLTGLALIFFYQQGNDAESSLTQEYFSLEIYFPSDINDQARRAKLSRLENILDVYTLQPTLEQRMLETQQLALSGSVDSSYIMGQSYLEFYGKVPIGEAGPYIKDYIIIHDEELRLCNPQVMPVSDTRILIHLLPQSLLKADINHIINEISKKLIEIPGIQYRFLFPDKRNKVIKPCLITLHAEDYDQLSYHTAELMQTLARNINLNEAVFSYNAGNSNLVITPDDEMIARYGFNSDEISFLIDLLSSSNTKYDFYFGTHRIKSRAVINTSIIDYLHNLDNLDIFSDSFNSLVSLQKIIDVRIEDFRSRLYHDSSERAAFISFNTIGENDQSIALINDIADEYSLSSQTFVQADIPAENYADLSGIFKIFGLALMIFLLVAGLYYKSFTNVQLSLLMFLLLIPGTGFVINLMLFSAESFVFSGFLIFVLTILFTLMFITYSSYVVSDGKSDSTDKTRNPLPSTMLLCMILLLIPCVVLIINGTESDSQMANWGYTGISIMVVSVIMFVQIMFVMPAISQLIRNTVSTAKYHFRKMLG